MSSENIFVMSQFDNSSEFHAVKEPDKRTKPRLIKSESNENNCVPVVGMRVTFNYSLRIQIGLLTFHFSRVVEWFGYHAVPVKRDRYIRVVVIWKTKSSR